MLTRTVQLKSTVLTYAHVYINNCTPTVTFVVVLQTQSFVNTTITSLKQAHIKSDGTTSKKEAQESSE